jgi:type IV secretion system protein VirB2
MNTVRKFLALKGFLLSTLSFCALALVGILFPDVALAETTKTLPYEEGIEVIYNSMTGPVPFVISLVGIVACGAMLIFGGEISGFMRTIVFVILVVAIIVQAGAVVNMLGGEWKQSGGASGALLPVPNGQFV